MPRGEERKRPLGGIGDLSSWAQSVAPQLSILVWGAAVVRFHAADATENQTANETACQTDTPSSIGIERPAAVARKYFKGMFGRAVSGGPENLEPMDLLFLAVIIILALEFLSLLVKKSGLLIRSERIPVRGKHLDEFSTKDHLFIGMNRAATAPFVFFLVRYLYHEPNAVWDLSKMKITNILLPIPIIFVIYDFFYTILHWALHIKAVYGYIHKHHHHQKAPSRATIDAINVHPIEFFLGEYNHIFACYLFCRVLNMELHAATSVLFLVIGAFLAGLNHTRYDVAISLFGVPLYDSKFHDVHHRIPQSNYGQYTMLWDHVLFGSFREYNATDRVRPRSQLDPRTGKSLQYMEEIQSKKIV